MKRLVTTYLLSFVLSMGLHAQEEINLDMLFGDWAVSYNESDENHLVLRNPKDKKLLSEEDRKIPYSFKITGDSLISKTKFPRQNSRGFFCPVGSSVKIDTIENYYTSEVWFLNYEKKALSYGICFEVNTNSKNLSCAYKANYRIDKLRENYMKLTLLQEYVGEE